MRLPLAAPPLAAACALAACASAPAAVTGPSAVPAARGALVWAVGDAIPGPQATRLARLVRRSDPDLFLYLGDVYETGTAEEFRSGYDPLYGPLARRTIPTPGNHEWPNRASGYRPYWLARTGRPMPDLQRRTIAGWEILALNSEIATGPSSRQVRWLRRVVRTPGTCRIAIFHRPRFSRGYHGSVRRMDTIWRTLSGHARLVLSGHDHDLQRFATRDGLRQYVSGAGGRENRPVSKPRLPAPRLMFQRRTVTGGLRLRLSPGRATAAFVAADGRVLDRSAARCTPLR